VEDLINKYMGFSMDGVALFYTMIYTWQIWLFYDNSKFADIYGIARADMIFYFWFGVVIIPFQIIVDVMFYVIMELYHKQDWDAWFK